MVGGLPGTGAPRVGVALATAPQRDAALAAGDRLAPRVFALAVDRDLLAENYLDQVESLLAPLRRALVFAAFAARERERAVLSHLDDKQFVGVGVGRLRRRRLVESVHVEGRAHVSSPNASWT